MKKNGFTLVELLAVIVILGVIGLIAFPTVNNLIKDSKEKAYQEQVRTIEHAAEKWFLENPYEMGDSETFIYVKVDTLKKAGHLNKEIIQDPRSDAEMNGCVKITEIPEYKQYEYTYSETECGTVAH